MILILQLGSPDYKFQTGRSAGGIRDLLVVRAYPHTGNRIDGALSI